MAGTLDSGKQGRSKRSLVRPHRNIEIPKPLCENTQLSGSEEFQVGPYVEGQESQLRERVKELEDE